MSTRRLVLPWAALGGLLVALIALALVRSRLFEDERILLWPTYQLLHLEVWHSPPWQVGFTVLLVQAMIWMSLFCLVSFVVQRLTAKSKGGTSDQAA